MKITYLKLKNFSSIYTGMKKKSIEIDFSQSQNRIIVLVGKTGSGKTSILSQLNPYAYPTNDSRSRHTMIMNETEGYKEIHYDDNATIYKIKHFYKNHNDKTTVKSFIEKNGEELNPNGNVTSFKDIIEEELHVTEDYMKLMRIGPNVQTLLKMPSRSRKEFMGELLKEIDVYNTFYKNVSEKVRNVKALMKAVASRMERLGIVDIESTIAKYEGLKGNLAELHNLKDDLSMRYGEIVANVNLIDVSGKQDAETNLMILEKEIMKIESDFDEVRQLIMESGSEASDCLIALNKEKAFTEIEIQKKTNEIDMNNNKISSLHEEIDRLELQTIDTPFSNLYQSEYDKLKLKVEADSENFSKVKTYYAPEDLKQLLRLLMEIESINDTIQTFGRASVKRVVDDILLERSTINRVNQELDAIEHQEDLLKRKLAVKDVSTEGYLLFLENHDCPYKDFYDEAFNKEDDVSELPDKLHALNIRKDMYQNELQLPKNFEYILRLINVNKSIIDKCPPGLINYNKMLESIRVGDKSFDEEEITMVIELYNLYDIHVKEKERLKEMESQLIEGRATFERNEQIKKKILDIKYKASELSLDNFGIRDLIAELNVDLEKYDKQIAQVTLFLEEDIKSKRIDKENLEIKIKGFENDIRTLNGLHEERMKIKNSLAETVENIKFVEKEISRMNVEIHEYEKLEKERDELENSYDDLYLIRKSLSPNEGAQLIFIQVYLERTVKYINNLLDKVYKGDLRINRFVINETDFLIPYVKNGILVPDISECSQGEESYSGMALSFALMFQSISKYNIPNLDEIDGPLDIDSREHFIPVLDEQLNEINAEQCFLITHNDLFEDYPVDVISTSVGSAHSMKNKNILFQA